MLLRTLALGLVCLLALIGRHGAAAQNVTVCWGDGSFGNLGNGKGPFTADSYFSNVPVEVSGGHLFDTVCAGVTHSCALEPSGKAWCWGDDGASGNLGTGSNGNSATPVAVSGGHSFMSIGCGGDHTCALDKEGQAWCWGSNSLGQLGAAGISGSNVPVKAAAGLTFVSLTAGTEHNCGLQGTGHIHCWGDNSMGQLGRGSADSISESAMPAEVAGGQTFQYINSGYYQTCAIEWRKDSQAWCWGDGDGGVLGNGANVEQPSPTPVAGGRNFYVVAPGVTQTCALAEDGSAWCWGKSPGNGQTTSVNQPAQVSGGHKFVALSTGTDYACGLDTSGDLWCWGNNDIYGKLGDGGMGSGPTPVKVAGGYTFLNLGRSKDRHMCGIATKQAGQAVAPEPPSPVPSPSPSSAPATTSTGSAAASPVPPAGPSTVSSSSSVPFGAIVGGAVAGLAVLCVLAFFALRPKKGWLRGKPTPTSLENGDSSKATSTYDSTSAVHDRPGAAPAFGMPPPAAAVPGSALGPDTLLPRSRYDMGSAWGPDTFLPYGTSADPAPTAPAAPLRGHMASTTLLFPPGPGPVPLPNSYISSSGLGTATPPAAAPPGHTASRSSSAYSLNRDPMLLFISSYLDTHPHSAAQHQQAGPLPSGGSANGGSGTIELRTDARVWEVQWPELTIVRLIGQGSYGSVYLAEWNQTQVAVKVLVGKDCIVNGQLELPDKVAHDLHAEAAVMSHMRHPNIVQFMGLVALPPALITEYCSRGSLYDCLTAARQHAEAATQLTWARRLGMAIDAGTGLLYLQRRNVIHRDVKSPNLLVDEHWRVKVADFNLSRLLSGARPESSHTTGGVMNPMWLAPEVMNADTPTAAGDVYSFGMVMYELLTWRLPWNFSQLSPFKVIATIREGGRPEVPPREALPGPDTAGWTGLDDYVQLMRECWSPRPDARPTFDEVVGRLRRLLDGAPHS